MIGTPKVSFFHSLLLDCVSSPLWNLETLFGIQSLLANWGRKLFLQLTLMDAGIPDVGLGVALERIRVLQFGLKNFSLQIFGITMSVKELVKTILFILIFVFSVVAAIKGADCSDIL